MEFRRVLWLHVYFFHGIAHDMLVFYTALLRAKAD